MIHVSGVFRVGINNPCANKKRHPPQYKMQKTPKTETDSRRFSLLSFHFYSLLPFIEFKNSSFDEVCSICFCKKSNASSGFISDK